ncbi:AAA family ATPase [Tsuneonella amylolytica]|uniref:AAA family ATPase n=1 Tax=Tsuneonella amylolytica TaxID=2338327 RepID=UPI000EA878C2|nr:AAA family ATPase [Tsuneonella amylolytica]
MNNGNTSPPGEAERYWTAFGFKNVRQDSDGKLWGDIPDGTIAFTSVGADSGLSLRRALQAIGTVPDILAKFDGDHRLYLYALDPELPANAIRSHFKAAGEVRFSGDRIALPQGDDLQLGEWPQNAGDLAEFDTLDGVSEVESSPGDLPQQVVGGTLLDEFSILDADLGDEAVKSRPLLGLVVLSGQATVIYAPPNSGKTLLTLHLVAEAVEAGRVVPQRCYYVNADDSLEGVHVKRSILAEVGVHTLVPGMQGFDVRKLSASITSLIAEDDCGDVVIIVDTLKKFVDLMDKKGSAAFGDVVRRFVLKGGTFLALAHTRKNEGPDGQLVYGGTSDVVEDFDAACLLVPLEDRTDDGLKLVQFQFRKRRGRNFEEAYGYDDDPSLNYEARYASVRLVTTDEYEEQQARQRYRSDIDLIEGISAEIAGGCAKKMALVRKVGAELGASRSQVLAVLDRYTGDDPYHHRWFYSVEARGAKVYRLHVKQEDGG